jgi:D-beta-D-heptose 7-phosphate kinase/D-beta-D-heptose 1-phosphate adenosyltransferase
MICVSGGFDPLHVGHLRMFEEAALLDPLCVILNSDDWLVRKKGYRFQSWESRAEIIRALRCVEVVESVDDADGTVCEALNRLRPEMFANGGDRRQDNTPESELCRASGIRLIWGVGGEKAASSSEIVSGAKVERDWGSYLTLGETPSYKVKELRFVGMKEMSLQRHMKRSEHWLVISGKIFVRRNGDWRTMYPGNSIDIPPGMKHQAYGEGVVIEIQTGESFAEDDICRG